MDPQLAGLQVTYTDAKKLFGTSLGEHQKRKLLDRKEKVDAWEIPTRHFICIRGIYVDFQRLEGVTLPSETDEEEEFLEHPEGDPTKPCVEFPCKLWQLKEFLNQEGISEYIDPFDMADWVRKKLINAVSEAPSQQEKPSLLLTIAVLLNLLKASQNPRYNQAGIIESIKDGDDGYVRGLSPRNLGDLFSAANKALKEARKNSHP